MSLPTDDKGNSAQLTIDVLRRKALFLGASFANEYQVPRGNTKDNLIAFIVWKYADVYPICVLQDPGFVPDPGETICFQRPRRLPQPPEVALNDGLGFKVGVWHRMDSFDLKNDIYQRIAGLQRLKAGLHSRWNDDRIQLAKVSSDDGLLVRLSQVSHKDALVAVAQYLDFSFVPASRDYENFNLLNLEGYHRWTDSMDFKALLRKLPFDPDRRTRFEQYRMLLVRGLLKIVDMYQSTSEMYTRYRPHSLPQIPQGVPQVGVARDFHIFPKLPLELRYMIFEWALEAQYLQPYVIRGKLKFTRRAPALFHVNRETRGYCMNIHLSKYQQFGGFWFRPEKDTIYLGRRSYALSNITLPTQTMKTRMPELMGKVKNVAYYMSVTASRSHSDQAALFAEMALFTNSEHIIGVYNDNWLTFEPHFTTIRKEITATVDFAQVDKRGHRGLITGIVRYLEPGMATPTNWRYFPLTLSKIKNRWMAGEEARVDTWNDAHPDPADHIAPRTSIMKFSMARATNCEKDYHLSLKSKYRPVPPLISDQVDDDVEAEDRVLLAQASGGGVSLPGSGGSGNASIGHANADSSSIEELRMAFDEHMKIQRDELAHGQEQLTKGLEELSIGRQKLWKSNEVLVKKQKYLAKWQKALERRSREAGGSMEHDDDN